MTRPNRPMSAEGPEQILNDSGMSYVLRQVGWIGQTGGFYALDEDPRSTEPGSFSPLYFVAHDEQLPTGRPEALHPADWSRLASAMTQAIQQAGYAMIERGASVHETRWALKTLVDQTFQ